MASWFSRWRFGSTFDLGYNRTLSLICDSCSKTRVDDLQPPVLRSSSLYAVRIPSIPMLNYHPSDIRSSTEGYEGNLTPAEEVWVVLFGGFSLGGPQTR